MSKRTHVDRKEEVAPEDCTYELLTRRDRADKEDRQNPGKLTQTVSSKRKDIQEGSVKKNKKQKN